ncbi:MAG: polyheme membrane-associated cytochrome C [Anaerolineales bacterium]|nr:polyheme membrane-associated cytochrome C [Anaerolineales bacterium]
MSLKKMLVLVGLVLVVAVVLAACGAAATPAPTEAPVVVEPTATEAPTAVPTVDPAIEITAIFAESGHADAAAEAFIHWDAETEVPTSCAKCHSEAGFVDFIADGSVDAAAAVPNAPFTCTMCHNDAADALTSVTFPSGAVVENLGPEARCMTCHQGRQSKVSVDKKITDFAVTDMDVVVEPIPAVDASGAPVLDAEGKPTTVKFSFPNVHYFAAAGTLYGSQTKIGYEYDGKIYDMKHQHVDGFNTCIGCHDQHSLEVKVEACAQCHEGVASVDDLKNVREPSSSKDYDGDGDKEEGVAFEIEGLQETLYTSIKAYATEVVGTGIVYDAATNPYWFVDADGDGAIDQVDGKNVSYTFFTARLLKATYNYQVSVKDPGAFAHGGKYMIELLLTRSKM